jgi:hypothetical protein
MNSNDEYVNQITLRYLTSVDYQNDVQGDHDKHNEGNKINKSKQKGSKIYRQKDKKFYKKRISNIIKLLLNDGVDNDNNNNDNNNNNINQPNCPLFPDIKNTFDIFIRTCIDYLKSQDKCDIIQNDYNNFPDVISSNPNIMVSEPANNIINNNEINALMMRKILKKKNSIDSFVKRTSTRQTATIIPQKKKINLHDPELKTKGLGVLLSGTVAKPPKTDTPPQKDKNMCENKNNNIYKETTVKPQTLLKYDNQEEKPSNEKKNKKHTKESKDSKVQKDPKLQKGPPSLPTSQNTDE